MTSSFSVMYSMCSPPDMWTIKNRIQRLDQALPDPHSPQGLGPDSSARAVTMNGGKARCHRGIRTMNPDGLPFRHVATGIDCLTCRLRPGWPNALPVSTSSTCDESMAVTNPRRIPIDQATELGAVRARSRFRGRNLADILRSSGCKTNPGRRGGLP